MKNKTHLQRGLTLMEVLLVIVVFGVLAALMLPFAATTKEGGSLVRCRSNLKQVGLGFRLWANDNGDHFPWAVESPTGGTLEFGNTPQVFRHFQIASNEFVSPRILVCRTDSARMYATNFAMLANANLSYFINLGAADGQPRAILSGDRNVAGGRQSGTSFWFGNTNISWTAALHTNQGNVVLGDGSTQQFNNSSLRKQLAAATNGAIRLAIP